MRNTIHKSASILWAAALIGPVASGQPSSDSVDPSRWVQEIRETLDGYCYQTRADYEWVVEIAQAMDLTAAPDTLLPLILGPDSVEGRAFVVSWDRDADIYLMLGVSKPNACGIAVQGIEYQSVEPFLKEDYRFQLEYRNDIGLQVSELFSVGRRAAASLDQPENGFMMVVRSKQSAPPPIFSVTFVPAETMRAALSD